MAVGFNTNFLAGSENGFDFGVFWARNEAVNKGNGKATFVVFEGFTGGFDDLGVNKGSEAGFCLIFGVVADDDNATINTELGSGHSNRKLVRMIFFPF